MKSVDLSQMVMIIDRINVLMQENKDYLIELDSALGDGDLGLTMSKGFAAAYAAAKQYEGTDIGELLMKSAIALASAAPSTMGTLMASAFMGAGKALKSKGEIDVENLGLCFGSMVDEIKKRGKAKEGDKTILDVLCPVEQTVRNYRGEDLENCLKQAYRQAKISLELTRDMINRHGKAAVFREKTLGKLDPGAAAACIMIQGFYEGVGGKEGEEQCIC